jgi:L-asparagine oxygenase
MSRPISDSSVHRLAHDDVDVLTRAAQRLRDYDLRRDTERFVLEAQIEAARLSVQLRRTILTFRRFSHPDGALVLRGVPVGEVPPTPTKAGDVTTGTQSAAGAMSILLAQLGDQYGFRPELGGSIVQDILPVRAFHGQEISIGSTMPLSSHVEMAFSPFRSDYVALLCLREDHEARAATTVSSIVNLLPLLDAETVDVLRMPRFRTRVDQSFLLDSNHGEDIWIDPISVFSGPKHRPQLRVDFAETEGKDRDAVHALAVLLESVSETLAAVHLLEGDLLVVDNKRALHGRTSFTPRYDGNDRWLLRSFVTRDLSRSECVRPTDDRIVEAEYAAQGESA